MPYTTSSGLKIYFEVAGEKEKPALLMIHGNGNCTKDWYGLGYVKALEPHFRLVMLDCRGYGKSDKPHDSKMYTPESITQDCIAVLDEAGVQKTHFYGGSRGANIGLLLAKKQANRFLSFNILDAEVYEDTAHQGFVELLKSKRESGILSVVEEIEGWLGKRFPSSIREDYLANDIDAMIAASSMRYHSLADSFLDHQLPCRLMCSNSEPWNDQMPRFSQKNPHCQLHHIDTLSHAELYWDADVVSPIIIESAS